MLTFKEVLEIFPSDYSAHFKMSFEILEFSCFDKILFSENFD